MLDHTHFLDAIDIRYAQYREAIPFLQGHSDFPSHHLKQQHGKGSDWLEQFGEDREVGMDYGW